MKGFKDALTSLRIWLVSVSKRKQFEPLLLVWFGLNAAVRVAATISAHRSNADMFRRWQRGKAVEDKLIDMPLVA